jgi:hypothetical protein
MISRKAPIVFLFFCFKINAQEIKLGKVTITDLGEKKHSTATTAVPALLLKKSGVFFTCNNKKGFVVDNEFTHRIKIYKKEGFTWVNFEIPYYVGYEN